MPYKAGLLCLGQSAGHVADHDAELNLHKGAFSLATYLLIMGAGVGVVVTQVLVRLTEDEATPLGLPLDELAEHYSALLMVPRWKAEEGSETEYGGLDLLLVRNEDHE